MPDHRHRWLDRLLAISRAALGQPEGAHHARQPRTGTCAGSALLKPDRRRPGSGPVGRPELRSRPFEFRDCTRRLVARPVQDGERGSAAGSALLRADAKLLVPARTASAHALHPLAAAALAREDSEATRMRLFFTRTFL